MVRVDLLRLSPCSRLHRLHRLHRLRLVRLGNLVRMAALLVELLLGEAVLNHQCR
jgi:hypothetical protein